MREQFLLPALLSFVGRSQPGGFAFATTPRPTRAHAEAKTLGGGPPPRGAPEHRRGEAAAACSAGEGSMHLAESLSRARLCKRINRLLSGETRARRGGLAWPAALRCAAGHYLMLSGGRAGGRAGETAARALPAAAHLPGEPARCPSPPSAEGSSAQLQLAGGRRQSQPPDTFCVQIRDRDRFQGHPRCSISVRGKGLLGT
jgi:hypothetical protein